MNKKLYIGLKRHKLTLVEFLERKNGKLRIKIKCDCGEYREIYSSDFGRNIGCQKCAKLSINNPRYSGYEYIPGTFFKNIKENAKKRDIKFNISIEYINDLFEQQKFRCIYSNVDIKFSKLETTASLDRIDSSKGYEIGNVQWVHKYINLMKNILTQEQFLNYCVLISKHQHKPKVTLYNWSNND